MERALNVNCEPFLPVERRKKNPKMFLKLIGMQTVRPEILEYLRVRELARVACLCKFTYAKITADKYIINFVFRWKLKVKDWNHFQQLIKKGINYKDKIIRECELNNTILEMLKK